MRFIYLEYGINKICLPFLTVFNGLFCISGILFVFDCVCKKRGYFNLQCLCDQSNCKRRNVFAIFKSLNSSLRNSGFLRQFFLA
ncbi:hypothetical protein FRUB_04049 [Fimbriiglobus ruber]|uniref:Uncharacterized protein n=1 Tax=Fimbriiglobus ruber TaxID=1908690 RepID=A0A225DKK2_9BACT|nr:hypothetical protein FRUB_04049 [Fimbriiglobus ruber]